MCEIVLSLRKALARCESIPLERLLAILPHTFAEREADADTVLRGCVSKLRRAVKNQEPKAQVARLSASVADAVCTRPERIKVAQRGSSREMTRSSCLCLRTLGKRESRSRAVEALRKSI